MDERAALELISSTLPAAGDDAAVLHDLVVTTDMLHERTDFPEGVTRYTAGWRAVGASLSDVAAMGAAATGAVAVYATPKFDPDDLEAFLDGATAVCESVGTEYVGGDLDSHQEFTVATTALGTTDSPVRRSGATPGDAVCLTGALGRSAAAVRLFERAADDQESSGDGSNADDGEESTADDPIERANTLFQFAPRVATGRALAPHATTMMDVSDGLARSCHQLAAASDCGIAVESPLPVADPVEDVARDARDRRELSTFFGEDFELLATIPESEVAAASEVTPVKLTRIGTVTEAGVTLDGNRLPDRGYTHG